MMTIPVKPPAETPQLTRLLRIVCIIRTGAKAGLSSSRPSAAMRALLAIVIAATVMIAEAKAEWQMFIISSNADGYGVDRCLETGAKCGAAVAAAYCKSRQFIQAASYRKIERDEITGSVRTKAGVCDGIKCDEMVAIICTR